MVRMVDMVDRRQHQDMGEVGMVVVEEEDMAGEATEEVDMGVGDRSGCKYLITSSPM